MTSLGMARGAADEATPRRLFADVDADALNRLLRAFMWTLGRAVCAASLAPTPMDAPYSGRVKSKLRLLQHGSPTLLGARVGKGEPR